MTTTYPQQVAGSALAKCLELWPLISEQATATEGRAQVAEPVVEALKAARLPWILLPAKLGGLGLPLQEALRVVEEVSRADGSTGWSFMAVAFETAILAGYLDRQGLDDLFPEGKDPALVAGMLFPKGLARKIGDGFQLDGEWAFASGSDIATWIGAGFMVANESGEMYLDDQGQPETRIGLVPKDVVEFNGGWDVWGLVGTGSYNYTVRATVPIHRTILTFAGTPNTDDAMYRLGSVALAVIGHAAVALGIAQRALEEVTTLAYTKKRPGQSQTVGENDLFRHDFTLVEATLRAARGFLYEVVDEALAAAQSGEPLNEHLARFRQVTTWIHHVANDVVDFAHRWGGTASIRANSALGRCIRDMKAGSQHILVDSSTLIDAAPEIMRGYRAS